jgi:hypothetical protein
MTLELSNMSIFTSERLLTNIVKSDIAFDDEEGF